ncbi:carcinoembryonic antigen-related cell adhesion molecule 2-like [Carassius auratus]|uniref:Carcinoembryonic antigen-related cell adhesion molecule 2-like n=1 Tax=Carassius auratus TaxID=7957 RepID=A0A6P6NCB7_CARAU|nr:carcinoembryonic antigen-related cell adhesion molecule 2-like [Carassius auratus]
MNVLIWITLCGSCVQGAAGVDEDRAPVSVTEGNSVTLHTDVTTNQQDRIKWYFGKTLIAQITGGQSKICTGVQCKERFRDRLELDHQTGSLTIMNINLSDSGEYTLQIISRSILSEKIVHVSVCGVSGEQDEMKRKSVKEGESVTLHPGVGRKANDLMTWYCNGIVIVEITGDQSKICSDADCKDRFGDRLKLDHQTGSLTIMNTTNTDSGEYKLQIRSSSSIVVTSLKGFSVYITAVPDSGLSPGAVAGICVALLLVVCGVGGVLAKRKGEN